MEEEDLPVKSRSSGESSSSSSVIREQVVAANLTKARKKRKSNKFWRWTIPFGSRVSDSNTSSAAAAPPPSVLSVWNTIRFNYNIRPLYSLSDYYTPACSGWSMATRRRYFWWGSERETEEDGDLRFPVNLFSTSRPFLIFLLNLSLVMFFCWWLAPHANEMKSNNCANMLDGRRMEKEV